MFRLNNDNTVFILVFIRFVCLFLFLVTFAIDGVACTGKSELVRRLHARNLKNVDVASGMQTKICGKLQRCQEETIDDCKSCSMTTVVPWRCSLLPHYLRLFVPERSEIYFNWSMFSVMNLMDQTIYSQLLNDLLFFLNGHINSVQMIDKLRCYDCGRYDLLDITELERIKAVDDSVLYASRVIYDWNPNFRIFLILTNQPRRVADNLLRCYKGRFDNFIFDACEFVQSQNFLFYRLSYMLPLNTTELIFVEEFIDRGRFYEMLCEIDVCIRADRISRPFFDVSRYESNAYHGK